MTKMKKGRVRKMAKTGNSAALAVFGTFAAWYVCSGTVCAGEEPVTLRVCNWEEYIDLGEWDEDEVITLDNGVVIYGDRKSVV